MRRVELVLAVLVVAVGVWAGEHIDLLVHRPLEPSKSVQNQYV